MNIKRRVTGILSVSVLLLLPAFAAAGQRKAVKKAALPRLVSDGAAFRPFSKPAAGAGSTTTEDGGEASGAEVNGAQSTGGAGVSVGAVDKQVAQGSGLSSRRGGGGFPGQPACTPRAAVTSVQSVCSWNYTGTVGPAPLMPSGACTQSNAGAFVDFGPARSYTCVCSQQPVVTQAAVVCPKILTTPTTQGPVPAGCSILPVTWAPGLEMRQGMERTPRQTINAGEMQAFRMTGTSLPGGHVSIDYAHCNTDFSVSANACDWETVNVCAAGGINPNIVVQTSDQPRLIGACVMEAGKPFYLNVRPSVRGAGAQMMGENCPYYLSW